MEINPILDMYQMLENYLPGGVVDKEEVSERIAPFFWSPLVQN